MSAKRKRFVIDMLLPAVVLGVVVVVIFLAYAPHVEAINKRIPLWGNYDARTCIWHSDTNESGDEIVHADDYHWDTISMVGHNRQDSQHSYACSFLDVWRFDGFKLFLSIDSTSPGCSIRVHFNMGTTDTMYATLHDSTEGASIKKIYDFTNRYSNDSLIYMDRFEVDIIVGDTITDDRQEFDRKFEVRGALFGKN